MTSCHPGPARVAAAVCLVALSVISSPARAADDDTSVQVTVNGEPVSVEGALAAAGFDVSDQSYTLCQTDGSSTQLGVSGWSVEAVLKAAGVSADQVSSVSIPRIAGSGDVVLHPADYDPSAAGYRDFPEGPAVLVRRTVGADETPQDDFFRPSRSTDCAADPNGPDYVRTPNGAVLEFDIASGTQLQVSSTVDHSSVSAGQSATFTGSVANPPPGETLNYRWQFGDGTIGTGATVTHSYASAGTYSVTLTADSGAAAGGVAAPLTETVASAPGSAGPAATASPSAKAKPGGTTQTRRPAHTVASVPASARPSPASASPATTATTASAVSPGLIAASAGAAPTASVSTPVLGPSAATPSPSMAATPAPSLPGVPVSGALISLIAGPRPAAATPADQTVAALQQALGPHGTQRVGSHAWAPFAAGAGLLILIGAGALAEFRGTRKNGAR